MRLTFIEVIARLIPEVFLVILSIIILSNKKVDKKQYLKSCLVGVVCGYIVRSMPISYGIHTVLNIICFVLISILMNNIDVVTTIRSTIVTFITMLIIESFNVWLLSILFGDIINTMLEDVVTKTLLGLPSIILYSVFIAILYKVKKK